MAFSRVVRICARLHYCGFAPSEIDAILEQDDGMAHTCVMRYLSEGGEVPTETEDLRVKKEKERTWKT